MNKKFTIPEEIYEVSATFEGKIFRKTIKSGQSVIPYYNSKTKEVVWVTNCVFCDQPVLDLNEAVCNNCMNENYGDES